MATDDFSPDSLRLDAPRPTLVARQLRKEKFVKGPIPLPWVTAAARLTPARALHVALAIYYRSGLRRSMTVRISPQFLAPFGVNRFTAYRALNALESAGLIAIERHRGRAAVVTILPVKPTADA